MRRGIVATLAALALTSCAANPGPPPLVEPEQREEPTSEPAEAPEDTRQRSQVQVGVDPIRAGFNPHLAGDESAVVADIADLVLPSAFRDGMRDNNVLLGASRLPTTPGALTVRYIIAPEAQWSDGTPITGADFAYLWRGMTTTPGVVAPAGYRAISAVRVSGPAGKTVDVDFAEPVGQWRSLFSHLLPSHLLATDASDFAYALRNTVPASAGRYLMADVDRGRGTVTLNRNDRFWGPDPAPIDIVTLVAARDTTQTADQLRARQLAFVEAAPGETTRDVFSLIDGVEVRVTPGPRTLGAVLSATSGLDTQARAELRSLIDVPLLAHIASRRASDVTVAAHAYPQVGSVDALRALATHRGPVKVAADATDPAAAAAARSLVDLLTRQGVPSRLVTSELHTIAGRGLPDGDVDVVVAWRYEDTSQPALASRIACPPPKARAGNLAGYCATDTDALAGAILAGAVPAADAAARVGEIERDQVLWVPILHETRIAASSGVLPGGWPGSVASAGQWRVPADTVKE